ncbi:uncharacterized protein LOC127876692 [Dreissena polymorpha]|uniref:uncharacterized protein LOC127876692 n=1 Tax=Dreissena polymorpha TaxID=45954 RepID=UPI00226495B3|nr:uncharacterized protein LOC127876692 [Dreissena polymorpha]
MLKNICFKNFVVFRNEEDIEFRAQCPYIFIGENGSGKSAVFEGIRRCLKADMNTSVSKPCNPKEVSYFICRFKLDNDHEEIISGTVYIPLNKALHFCPKDTIEDIFQNDYGLSLLFGEDELDEDLSTSFSEEDFNGKEGGNKDELKLISTFKLDKTGPDASLELEDTIDTAAEKDIVTTPELGETKKIIPEFDETTEKAPGLADIDSEGHYYQFAIQYVINKRRRKLRVRKFCCDFLNLPKSTQDKGNIKVHEVRNLNTYALLELHNMLLSKSTHTEHTIQNILLQNLWYKKIEIARVDASMCEPSTTPCQSVLIDLSKHLVFTFPLRSIGPLQWSESERIKGDMKEANYEEALKRSEIITAFLENQERYDNSIEQDVFEEITHQSAEYEFALDGGGKLQVNHNSMKLLKTPEGILEAKYVSILLSGKCFKTIILEEPDRGMHPQFVQRMILAIRRQAEANEKVVILTTHNTAFLTPWTLSSCYRFSRAEENKCRVNSVGKLVKHNLKTLRIMTNDKLSDIFFARRVLFCEGDSEILFLNEMKNVLLSTMRSTRELNPIYTTNAFLSDNKDTLQTVLSDLTIAKMNGVHNVSLCRSMCRSLCLPAKFLLDKDFKNLNKDDTNCFIWSNGAIEEMVLSMRDSCNDEKLTQIVTDLKLKPIENGKKRKGKDKLFMKENVTQKQITQCVEALFRNCDPSNDLGKIVVFLVQFACS